MARKRSTSTSSVSWQPPELTLTAERAYRKLYEDAEECAKAGDTSNSKITLFNMVDEAITKLIPHNPLDPARALSGPLSNIFRISKGRIRICYIASSAERRIIILYISESLRKAGDVGDPYAVFTKMVMSGQFDNLFASLGIKTPPRRSGQQNSIQ